ncbi:hypothetical protein PoB_002187600 [Plakobranchus ocellatus]|uniref:Uncharacterized protein n=1 Tax=Plakobranchus ocellatus TaxID=259542 RepID=A0AAV3ZHI4_9GAST|nr:hypothetical protein PoB_002187600 [Plakobranchus ocellatus]
MNRNLESKFGNIHLEIPSQKCSDLGTTLRWSALLGPTLCAISISGTTRIGGGKEEARRSQYHLISDYTFFNYFMFAFLKSDISEPLTYLSLYSKEVTVNLVLYVRMF